MVEAFKKNLGGGGAALHSTVSHVSCPVLHDRRAGTAVALCFYETERHRRFRELQQICFLQLYDVNED